MKIKHMGDAGNNELPQVEEMEKDAAKLVEPNNDQKQREEDVASFLIFGREKKKGKKQALKNDEYMKDAFQVMQEGHRRSHLVLAFWGASDDFPGLRY
jgi:hypothetical protein